MHSNIENLLNKDLKLATDDSWHAGEKIDNSSNITFDGISSQDIEAADVYDFAKRSSLTFLYTDPRTGTKFLYQGTIGGHYLLKNRINDFKEALKNGASEELLAKYSSFMDMILSLNNSSKIEEDEQKGTEDKLQIIEKGLENLSEFEQEHVPTNNSKGEPTISC
jgi:hypothetical protein